MGMNRSTVTNCLRILNLDPRVIDLALEGKLTEGHCRSLLGYEDPEIQYKMALKIIESQLPLEYKIEQQWILTLQ